MQGIYLDGPFNSAAIIAQIEMRVKRDVKSNISPQTCPEQGEWHGQALKGMAMILYFSIVDPFMAIGFAADHATRLLFLSENAEANRRPWASG